MRIAEVPPHAWGDTLDAFTAAHEGWLVSMASGRPVPRPSVTHVIEHAARVYLQHGHKGSTASLMIESEEGTRTVLRVRARAAASRGAA